MDIMSTAGKKEVDILRILAQKDPKVRPREKNSQLIGNFPLLT